MYLFWILWGIDALIAFTLVYFFFIGLGDGSVSSFNILPWLVILVGMAALLLGGYWLFTHQQTVLAKLLMAVLAVPGVLYGLFMDLCFWAVIPAAGNEQEWN